MNQTSANPSIACTVNTCAYHCGGNDRCSLTEIKVGCCDAQVTNCAATQCASFQLGAH